MCIEGVDFIGPDPSVLTFMSGQSTGDVRCADVTILDNLILDGERSFSIELGEVRSETNVKINETMTSVDIDIDDDPNDRKFVQAIRFIDSCIQHNYTQDHSDILAWIINKGITI
jgi:hypothetical protein